MASVTLAYRAQMMQVQKIVQSVDVPMGLLRQLGFFLLPQFLIVRRTTMITLRAQGLSQARMTVQEALRYFDDETYPGEQGHWSDNENGYLSDEELEYNLWAGSLVVSSDDLEELQGSISDEETQEEIYGANACFSDEELEYNLRAERTSSDDPEELQDSLSDSDEETQGESHGSNDYLSDEELEYNLRTENLAVLESPPPEVFRSIWEELQGSLDLGDETQGEDHGFNHYLSEEELV
jgi:hypothetical protein